METKLLEEIRKENTLDILNKITVIHHEAYDVLLDMLEEENLTVTERVFVEHILGMYLDIIEDFMVEDFGIQKVYAEDCDRNCDECSLSEDDSVLN